MIWYIYFAVQIVTNKCLFFYFILYLISRRIIYRRYYYVPFSKERSSLMMLSQVIRALQPGRGNTDSEEYKVTHSLDTRSSYYFLPDVGTHWIMSLNMESKSWSKSQIWFTVFLKWLHVLSIFELSKSHIEGKLMRWECWSRSKKGSASKDKNQGLGLSYKP